MVCLEECTAGTGAAILSWYCSPMSLNNPLVAPGQIIAQRLAGGIDQDDAAHLPAAVQAIGVKSSLEQRIENLLHLLHNRRTATATDRKK